MRDIGSQHRGKISSFETVLGKFDLNSEAYHVDMLICTSNQSVSEEDKRTFNENTSFV